MTEQVHDKRQAKLRWPAKRGACPKCRGAGDVHWTMQHVTAPRYEVIGGQAGDVLGVRRKLAMTNVWDRMASIAVAPRC